MRKLLIVVLLLISLAGFGQSKFFGPVDQNMFSSGDKALTGTWLVRPAFQFTAMQFILKNPVEVASLSQIGTGVSYAHFIEQNGEPYQNFAVSGLVLFGQDLAGVAPAQLSLAGTITAFQYINVGAGYTFGTKQFFILTGVTYNFNK